jgi:hypothetical protein
MAFMPTCKHVYQGRGQFRLVGCQVAERIHRSITNVGLEIAQPIEERLKDTSTAIDLLGSVIVPFAF